MSAFSETNDSENESLAVINEDKPSINRDGVKLEKNAILAELASLK